MPADGTPAPVFDLAAARGRRRPAAQSDAAADLVHLLTCPIPRDEDGRDELVGRLAARLAMVAIERRETDHSQVDVRDDYAADIDALVARLGAVCAEGRR